MPSITKLIPAAPLPSGMTSPPPGASTAAIVSFNEAWAASCAYAANLASAQNWLNWYTDNWLGNYNAGRLAWDAAIPSPPVDQWAACAEITDSNGSTASFVDFQLVPDPTGSLVCPLPKLVRQPPPQIPGAPGSLTGLVAAGTPLSNPTIPVVPVYQSSTASDGSHWMRLP